VGGVLNRGGWRFTPPLSATSRSFLKSPRLSKRCKPRLQSSGSGSSAASSRWKSFEAGLYRRGNTQCFCGESFNPKSVHFGKMKWRGGARRVFEDLEKLGGARAPLVVNNKGPRGFVCAVISLLFFSSPF